MVAVYPTLLRTFSAMTEGSTVLVAALFTDLVEELDAMQTHFGVFPHGTQGSIAERVDKFVDRLGQCYGNVKECRANDDQLRRVRAGIADVEFADLDTVDTRSARGTITWTPELSALRQDCHAIVGIQPFVNPENRGQTNVPSHVWYVNDTGSTTGFEYRVSTSANLAPADGDRFLIHWLAWERTLDGNNAIE